MQQASIVSPEDSSQLFQHLQEVFAGAEVTQLNEASYFIRKRVGWFRKVSLELQVRSLQIDEAFVAMMQQMRDFVADLPAENRIRQQALLAEIDASQTALACISTDLTSFEDQLFELTSRLVGFIFIDRITWYDGNRRLLLDNLGRSGL
ncbi:MAG: hypothetical protein QM669_10915 [Siphonobacter sp.]